MSRNAKNYNKNSKNSKQNASNTRRKAFNDNSPKKMDEAAQRYAESNNCNDPSWYVPTDQNISDVASFSLNNILGTDYKLDSVYRKTPSVSETAGYGYTAVPGVYSVMLCPTVGTSVNAGSAVNMAATDLYNEIRRANSGAKVYDAPDCMQLMIAVASIYSMIAWAQRIYGIANVYSSTNAYMPRIILEANMVDPESILNNMNSFRTRLNNLVLQANTFNVPKTIPLFARWYSMYTKVYADSNSPRAQMYQYIPYGFYVYDDTKTTLSIEPLTKTVYTNGLTYLDIIEYIENAINKLVYSEDARTISADIEKAFGANGLYNLGMIDESYSVIPDLSDEMRTQIMNARIPFPAEWKVQASPIRVSLSQDPTRAYLVANMELDIDPKYCGNEGGWWLNTHASTLTPEEVMTSTRLIPVFKDETFSKNESKSWVRAKIASCGSEVPVAALISVNTLGTTGDLHVVHTSCATSNLVVKNTTVNTMVAKVSLNSTFDWSPRMNFYHLTSKTVDELAVGPVKSQISYLSSHFDYDNGCMLSPDDLERLHTTALLGEFGIPKVRG